MTKFKKHILVIIPCYNESRGIVDVVRATQRQGLDYVVVNDGSIDDSLEILKKNKINHLDLINNLGIGGAMQAGYKYAVEYNYDIAVQLDGDGQHDIEYLETLVAPIIKGEAGLVVGSRFVGKESNFKSTKARQAGIKLLSYIYKFLTGQNLKDMTSGFRAVNCEIIKRFAQNYPSEYPEPVTNLMLAKSGVTIEEVPVKMHEREYGNSSISKFKSFYYMMNVLFLFIIVMISKKGDDVNV